MVKFFMKRDRESNHGPVETNMPLSTISYDIKTTLSSIESLLYIATREHFLKQYEDNVDNPIYGYALYLSDDASSVGPVANRKGDFVKDLDDPLYNYYRYGAQEWNLWEDFDLFTEVNASLSELMSNYPDEVDFCELREAVFEVFLSVLYKLKSESIFDKMGNDHFVAVWVSDSNSSIMSKSVELLNSDKVFAEYSKEYGK